MAQGFVNALTLTLPVGVTSGGTGLTSTTINQLLYSSGTSTIAGLATANNGVLVTSAGGAPSISSTLPTAVQSNITLLGTITSGVWNGSVLNSNYGGTGVNNGASTITLGGSLTTSGAFASTFTITGATNVTFPTSGTLATTSQLSSTAIPVGTMIDFAGSSVPADYLGCDGSAVSRATYSTLFAAIGITWGAGDGTTTFNLPSFARRAAVGSGGSGTAVLGNAVGNTGGSETITLTIAQMPAHNHPGSTFAASDQAAATSGTFTVFNSGGTTAVTVASQGGGGSHDNIQPSGIVLKCIKYQ